MKSHEPYDPMKIFTAMNASGQMAEIPDLTEEEEREEKVSNALDGIFGATLEDVNFHLILQEVGPNWIAEAAEMAFLKTIEAEMRRKFPSIDKQTIWSELAFIIFRLAGQNIDPANENQDVLQDFLATIEICDEVKELARDVVDRNGYFELDSKIKSSSPDKPI